MNRISVLIPTLNAARVLGDCLDSLKIQKYPKDLIEIIVADGGSTDNTLNIVRNFQFSNPNFQIKVIDNPLKTGEAGKAVALKNTTGNLILLLDSDNLLPASDWLQKMVEPFVDKDILGSEPWEFSLRKSDSYLNRYCALIGANDPYCYFVGNYDKRCLLSDKWTGLKMEEEGCGNYLKVKIKGGVLPTIGANGTLWRTASLKKAVGKSSYLFDTDIPYILAKEKPFYFAKVKIGIIHLYCRTVDDFVRKQKRRVRDFLYLEKSSQREQTYQRQLTKQLYFILSTIFFFPLFFQTVKGYLKKSDSAWFFHPFACLLTLWIYGSEIIRSKFKVQQIKRDQWKQ